ncbi:MAG: response regulator [Ardenticatenales bacterium]|nr:response regulator [Ardenticatenales bacterium]
MDSLLDNAPCGFLSFTDTGTIVGINATLLELLGYSPGELEGGHIESILSMAGRIFYQTHFFPLLKLHTRVEEVYLLLRSRGGENVPVLANALRRERDGAIVNDCVFVTMRQRARYEDEILQAKQAAEEANRLKDEFLATISHELRTPLTAILGWLHILRTRNPTPEKIARALAIIEQNAQLQAQLIEDLLDVSRIISGKMRLDVQPIDPLIFIEAAIESVRPAAEAKSIRLQPVLDTGVGFISGDAARLQQVVWNLVSNAIKFTPKGGRVQVRLERINSHIEIVVSDTGIGIRPDFLPHVFERFRQEDQTIQRRHTGLGLGLSIVRHLVELHGGEVNVYSPGEGEGTTFTVVVPLMIIHSTLDLAQRTHLRLSTLNQPPQIIQKLKGILVLVLDDEAHVREMLATLLGYYGAEVIVAASAEEAIEMLGHHRLDVLISDIGMAGEDGYAFMQRVRQLPVARGGRTPAIALSAYARVEDRLAALHAGYQMYITKPVEAAELIAVVASLVQRASPE